MLCYLLERLCLGSMRNQTGGLPKRPCGSGRSIKAVMRLFLRVHILCVVFIARKGQIFSFDKNSCATRPYKKPLPNPSGN